jgi:hypothetical protein
LDPIHAAKVSNAMAGEQLDIWFAVVENAKQRPRRQGARLGVDRVDYVENFPAETAGADDDEGGGHQLGESSVCDGPCPFLWLAPCRLKERRFRRRALSDTT